MRSDLFGKREAQVMVVFFFERFFVFEWMTCRGVGGQREDQLLPNEVEFLGVFLNRPQYLSSCLL